MKYENALTLLEYAIPITGIVAATGSLLTLVLMYMTI